MFQDHFHHSGGPCTLSVHDLRPYAQKCVFHAMDNRVQTNLHLGDFIQKQKGNEISS